MWSAYEGACSRLNHDAKMAAKAEAGQSPPADAGTVSKAAFTLARIEAHYFVNDMFMEDGALLDGIGRLAGIPAVIVQGRYDMVCPIASADALVRAWPGAPEDNGLEYKVIGDAGHAASEPGTRAALMAATERFKSLRG